MTRRLSATSRAAASLGSSPLETSATLVYDYNHYFIDDMSIHALLRDMELGPAALKMAEAAKFLSSLLPAKGVTRDSVGAATAAGTAEVSPNRQDGWP